MRRLRGGGMKYNPNEIKIGLTLIANRSDATLASSILAVSYKETALEALAYIRHLEGELRRQGFTDYTEKEDTND